MNIQIINPIEYPGWDDLLLTNPDSNFFQTTAWAKVLSESYNYKPLYFTIIEDGTLTALIPLMEIKSFLTGKRGVSLPFTDYSSPVLAKNQDLSEILQFIIGCGKISKWKYFELRCKENIIPSENASSVFLYHNLALKYDENEIFSSFRKGTKSSIKKAQKNGVKIELRRDSKSIREFYRLNCLTRKKHGVPPQPKTFFRHIFDHIIKKNHGIVASAIYDNKIIAAAVIFFFNNKAIYKYGASDQSYSRLSGTNLILWESIRWLCSNNFTDLCYGRSDIKNIGLQRFKRGWGTNEGHLYYYRYDLLINNYTIDAKDNQSTVLLFKNMPLPLLRLTGKLFYRHVG